MYCTFFFFGSRPYAITTISNGKKEIPIKGVKLKKKVNNSQRYLPTKFNSYELEKQKLYQS